MPTHYVSPISPAGPGEGEALDAFCSAHRGVEALGAIAGFLAERCGVSLVTDPEIVAGFRTDSSNLPGAATAVCRPRTERECALALRACFVAGIPVTVSAARSNLTGSATPEGGVVLSMARMTDPPPEVDAAAGTVRAPVGMILEDLRRAVSTATGGRLAFPVDPTSRADATVGGALACNASGFTPGEVGAMRRWVEALDVLLPDGSAVHARRGQYVSADGRFVLCADGRETVLPVPRYVRPAIKNAGGPFSAPDGRLDFVDLIVGSEGLFGVVTGCRLRLQPAPSGHVDIFLSLPAEEDAVRLRDHLAATIEGGLGALTALEYFGPNCRAHMRHADRLFHGNDPVAVYIQAPVLNGDADALAGRWLDLLLGANSGVREDAVLLLDNARDRTLFLEARHSMPAHAVEVVQRRGTFTIMTDTVVPADRFPEFLQRTHALIREAGLDYLAFGHLGDCHLHFTLLPTEAQVARATAVYDAIVASSAALGGVYSGEHGTGKRKRRDFLRCYGPEAVADVLRCKAALDPQFLLNRGNVVVPANFTTTPDCATSS